MQPVGVERQMLVVSGSIAAAIASPVDRAGGTTIWPAARTFIAPLHTRREWTSVSYGDIVQKMVHPHEKDWRAFKRADVDASHCTVPTSKNSCSGMRRSAWSQASGQAGEDLEARSGRRELFMEEAQERGSLRQAKPAVLLKADGKKGLLDPNSPGPCGGDGRETGAGADLRGELSPVRSQG